jgi:hypothetical protein
MRCQCLARYPWPMMPRRSQASLALLACAALAILVPGCGGRSSLIGEQEDAGDAGTSAPRDAARDARHDTSTRPPVDSGAHPDAPRHGLDAARDTGGLGDVAHPLDAPTDSTAPDAGQPVDAPGDGPPPDVCAPRTCLELGFNCGPAADGCGHTLDCGGCPVGEACDEGLGQCVTCVPGCVPWTCADLRWNDPLGGVIPDGCGNEIDCGTCACVYPGLPASCNGAVTMPPNVWVDLACCGTTNCLPKTCDELGISCGRAPDGCGGVLQCGECTAEGVCPMGGRAGACSPCVPQTCASQSFNCGSQGDGCGGTLDCGTCDPCVPCLSGVCAGVFVSDCVPATCESQSIVCGPAGDGCGNELECGTCESSWSCLRGICVPFCM